MADIKGLSLIIGTGIKYLGSYKRGTFFDNCEIQDIPKEQRTGSGIKLDVCFSRTIRPIGQFWKWGFWNDKTCIKDVPEAEWDNLFGKKLASKIRKNDKYRLKYRIFNPWYCLHAFILRLPKWIPSGFISVGIGTLFSFYMGNKSYQIDPLPGGRDSTWTNEKDIERAKRATPTDSYYALCPSFMFRKTRQT